LGFYILTILSKEVYEKNWYKTESVIEVLIFKRAKKYMLMLLAAAVIGTAFYTGYIIYDLFRQIQYLALTISDPEEKVLADRAEQREDESMDSVTFLVYGIDAGVWEGDRQQEEKGNADTIIMVNLDPGSGNIAMLSIPRDTLASIPGHNQTKINHAHSYGGSELLVETVNDFTGRSIDYFVGFDFHAFTNIIDLMGGIEFYLDRDVNVADSIIEAGQQKLDGEEAFAVIQSRRDPMGDVDRVKRQQRFLGTVTEEIGKMSLEELFFLGIVAWDQVDTNLDIMTGVSLADAFTEFSRENLEMEVLPGRFINIDDITYWETDPARNEEIINNLFYDSEGRGVESDD